MEKINFKKGESITLGFLLNAGYDMARIQSCSVWLGGRKFPLATIGQMLRCEIKSTETHILAGKYKLILWLDDSVLGIKKIEVADVEVSFNHANDNNTSINTGYDFVFPLAINETVITLGDILYDYVKGADGEKGEKGENGEDGAPAVLPPNIVIDANYVHTDNNFTDSDVLEVAKIANKVEKVAGKSLIADTEITRLATVENYDDTNVLNAIAGKEPANANIQQHISATGNPHSTKLTDLTNETLTQTTPTDTDSVITKVGSAIKASTFSSIYTYIKDKLLAASHTFSELITFSGGVKTSKIVPNGTSLAIRNAADTADIVKFSEDLDGGVINTRRVGANIISTTNEAGFRYTETYGAFGSNFRLLWVDGDYYYDTIDIGLRRNSAGILEINNGTAGTFRDLKLRSVIVSDNTAAASAAIVGAKRYREDANNSYIETCMKTGASTYAWIIEKQITW